MKICFQLIVLLATMSFSTACNSDKSDPETEAKLFGQWKTTETDDGLFISENISFFPDHTFQHEIGAITTDFTPLFHIEGTGTWSASKTTITQVYDVESIGMTYVNSYAIDMAVVADMVKELKIEMKEPQKSKIITIGPDASGDIGMTIETDGETQTWALVEAFEDESIPDIEQPDDEYSIDYPQVAEGDIHPLDVKYLYGAKASALKPHGNSTYIPENAFDGDLTTCWAIDIKENPDESNRLINVEVDCDWITGLVINNGYQKSEALYNKNNRPKNISITIADPDNNKLVKSTLFKGQLSDTFGPQRIEFDKPIYVRGETIGIFLEDWYEGTSYKDHLCISDIQFLGD